MHLFGELLTPGNTLFLLVALGMALSFEFVNGFHDTANAVATVIYTHSLRPWIAVIWSGLWNLFGVLTSTGAVAFGVVALLLLAGKLLIRRPELYEPPPKDTPPPWPVRLLPICTCTGVDHILPALSVINHRAVSMIDGKHGFSELSSPERSKLRSDIYLVGETINKLNKRVAGGGYLRRRSLHRFQPLRYEIKRVTRR
jgi:hypothetical protein